MIFESLIFSALLLDWFFGDPKWFPHPVRVIGWLCISFESFFRNIFQNEKIAGIFTSCTILIVSGGGIALLLHLLGLFSGNLQSLFAVFIIYTFVAIKDLLIHSGRVYGCLVPHKRIHQARAAIGQIVGRDTSNLDRVGICRACVETVAENMVDGITAPLFWAIIFSFFSLLLPFNAISFAAVGISIYKAANTMDSMFGYKNDKYLNFGWFSARFDDLINFLPARLSGVCIVIASYLVSHDWRNSFKIFLRDRLNHSSPNAGHTESALAGALGIQLGGTSIYFGKKMEKAYMGDYSNDIDPHHILKTHRIVLVSSLVFLAIILLVRRLMLILITA